MNKKGSSTKVELIDSAMKRNRLNRKSVFALALCLGLSACGGLSALNPLHIFGGSDDSKKEDAEPDGERISVLSLEQNLEADPRLADTEVKLPPPYINRNWTQPGGYASHAMHHLQIAPEIHEVWRVSAGKGADKEARILATPIVANGKIYVRDAKAGVAAFDMETGEKVWAVDLTPPKQKSQLGSGGGVAYDSGRVFVSTGFGFVVALDADTGAEYWRKNVGLTLRSAPTVADGRIFVSTIDNQLFALDADDGNVLWSHQGIEETARFLVSSSPAVAGDIVIVPYSSGEIFALRVQNGRPAWNDSLTRTGRLTSLSELNDIAGSPVVDRGLVIAISHNGRMVAIDLRTGVRVWAQNIGGMQTPWVAGDYIYVLTIDSQLVCLTRAEGRIKWITPLPQFNNQKKKKDPIVWSGPVLAGDRLLIVSSHSVAQSISPYTGEILGKIKLPGGSSVPPIVADEMVFILTDDAKLLAFK